MNFTALLANKKTLVVLGAFFANIIVNLIIWNSVSPGFLSPDSIDQITQAINSQFDNSHPVSYTLLIKLLWTIYPSASSITIFQIVMNSLLVSYITHTLLRLGISWKIVILAVIAFILNPVNSLYATTVWKDVLFSYGITLIIFILININHDKNRELLDLRKNLYYIAILSLATFLTTTLRHNGVVLLIVVPVIVLYLNLFSHKLKLLLAVVIISSYVIYSFLLSSLIEFEPAYFFQRTPQLQMTAAAITSGYNPTIEERDFIEGFYPIEDLRANYSCITHNMLIYASDGQGNYIPNRELFQDRQFREDFDRTSISIIQKNIPAVLGSRVCMFTNLMGFGNDRLLISVPLEQNNIGITREINALGELIVRIFSTERLLLNAHNLEREFVFGNSTHRFCL